MLKRGEKSEIKWALCTGKVLVFSGRYKDYERRTETVGSHDPHYQKASEGQPRGGRVGKGAAAVLEGRSRSSSSVQGILKVRRRVHKVPCLPKTG